MKKSYLQKNVKITQRNDGKYIIYDANTAALIDDAQGYGFSSFKKAARYADNQGWIITNQPLTPTSPSLF